MTFIDVASSPIASRLSAHAVGHGALAKESSVGFKHRLSHLHL